MINNLEKRTIFFYRCLFITSLLPEFTAILHIPSPFGFKWTGFAWLSMLLIAIITLLGDGKITMPWKIWIPWMLCITIYWLIDLTFFGLQSTLQYMCFPIVGFAASTLSYPDNVMVRIFKMGKFFILYLLLGGLFASMGVFIGASSGPTWVMTYSVFSALLLSVYFFNKEKILLIIYALFIFIAVLVMTRMGILMLLCIGILHFAKVKLFQRLILLGLLLISGIFIFQSKSFQEKTFYQGSGTVNEISLDNKEFNTNGRNTFGMWAEPGLKAHPYLGNGTRSDLLLFQSKGSTLKEMHNDYIAVRYIYGWMGMFLLSVAFIFQFILLYRSKKQIEDNGTLVLYYAALTVFIVWIGFMFSDNALKYSIYFGNYHWALIAIVYSRINNNQMSLQTIEI